MIKLARSLNFRVIAEHVEDMGALESARRMVSTTCRATRLGGPSRLHFLDLVTSLDVYPVKSCRGVDLDTACLTEAASSTTASG